jgi:solute carrier family 25 (mitochondrial carnitine/acylcarnitine transporter), member 20/29
MNEFIKGGIVGGSTMIIGYPLDTIKTNKQNNRVFRYTIKNLYKGMSYPLGFSMLFNSSLFSIHNYIYNKTENHFTSGFIAGSICSPILNTVELYKVNKQLYKTTNFKKPFLGIMSTMSRESIASSFYFGVYFYMMDKQYHPALSGGIAGISSWLTTYPIDTIKTRIQSKEYISYMEAIRKGYLFNGLSYCLARAFIVNSAGFYIYHSL